MVDWATTVNAAAAQATLRRDRLPQLTFAVGTSAFVASSCLLLDELSLRARHPSHPPRPSMSLRTEGRGTDLASALLPGPYHRKGRRSGSSPGPSQPPLPVITLIPAKTGRLVLRLPLRSVAPTDKYGPSWSATEGWSPSPSRLEPVVARRPYFRSARAKAGAERAAGRTSACRPGQEPDRGRRRLPLRPVEPLAGYPLIAGPARGHVGFTATAAFAARAALLLPATSTSRVRGVPVDEPAGLPWRRVRSIRTLAYRSRHGRSGSQRALPMRERTQVQAMLR